MIIVLSSDHGKWTGLKNKLVCFRWLVCCKLTHEKWDSWNVVVWYQSRVLLAIPDSIPKERTQLFSAHCGARKAVGLVSLLKNEPVALQQSETYWWAFCLSSLHSSWHFSYLIFHFDFSHQCVKAPREVSKDGTTTEDWGKMKKCWSVFLGWLPFCWHWGCLLCYIGAYML